MIFKIPRVTADVSNRQASTPQSLRVRTPSSCQTRHSGPTLAEPAAGRRCKCRSACVFRDTSPRLQFFYSGPLYSRLPPLSSPHTNPANHTLPLSVSSPSPACMPFSLRTSTLVSVSLSPLRRSSVIPRPTPRILAFSTSSAIMAPPKAALDFVDFVNASPTRMCL